MTIPAGLCQCGCGGLAPVPAKTNRSIGRIKGQPMRYIAGHHIKNPETHPSWRGGRAVRGGYTYIRAPEHGNAGVNGYVAEHVLVAAGVLGKPLPPGAVVHHVNGDKTDNRPCNLVICESQAYHVLLHARAVSLEESGHAGWRKCCYCKQYDDTANMSGRRDGRKVYHLECARNHMRSQRASREAC
jgi:hypothetical protein